MKSFTDFTDDERHDWRQNPVTRAFVEWMKAEADNHKTSAIGAVTSAAQTDGLDYRLATLYVGKMAAMDHAVDTATRSFSE